MAKKRPIAAFIAVACALLVVGCSTQPTNHLRPLSPKNITIKRPDLQTEATVEIGQSIMFWAYGPAKTVIELDSPFGFVHEDHTLTLADTEFDVEAMRGAEYVTQIEFVLAGGELTPVKPGELLMFAGSVGCTVAVGSSFSLPKKNTSSPVENISSLFTGERTIFGGSKPSQEYELPDKQCWVDQSTIADSDDSFRKELIYLGRSGDTIQLAYREFYKNMARPAFSNNIQYDLGESDVIGFQGARFKVISATNTFFTYEVLKHLQ